MHHNITDQISMEQGDRVVDEAGKTVKERFYDFIVNSQSTDESESTNSQQKLMLDYRAQINSMIQNDKTTLFVSFQHLGEYDMELMEAVEMEYYRFEPYLRKALQEYVSQEHREYAVDPNKGPREFFVAFYNLPRIERVRSMRTDRIGRLICISGTVTRTSEVKPELLFGMRNEIGLSQSPECILIFAM